jgi:hypothetical protein
MREKNITDVTWQEFWRKYGRRASYNPLWLKADG